MKAWHFVNDDYTLKHDLSDTKVEVGLKLTVDPELVELCEYGLHASIRPIDALKYAPGSILCLVELDGYIDEDEDKVVASERTILSIANLDRTLHEFALWCAEQALLLIPDADPRCQNAIDVKRRWLDGDATDDELDAARSAAWSVAESAAWSVAESAAESAAWSAAWSAARSAAWSAAWSAARSAARSAAWSVAESAARSAAWSVAESVAESAAWSAARSAAWSAQNEKLTEMIMSLSEFQGY